MDLGDWLANNGPAPLRLSDEGILVLSIRTRGGSFHGTPRGEDVIRVGDVLILYGDIEDIAKLDRRHAGYSGDKEHIEAVEEQEEFEESSRLERENDIIA